MNVDLILLGKWCGAITAIFGVLYPVGVFTKRKVSEIKELCKKITSLPERHEEAMSLITKGVTSIDEISVKLKTVSDVVNKELKVNGGGSMLDAIRDLRAQLAISDGKWKILASQLHMIGWESDEKGLCVWASPDMLRTLGCQEDDVLGESWKSLIAEKDRSRVFDTWDDCIQDRRSFIMSYNWIGIDNKLIPVQVESHVIRTTDGKVKGYVAVVRLLPKE